MLAKSWVEGRYQADIQATGQTDSAQQSPYPPRWPKIFDTAGVVPATKCSICIFHGFFLVFSIIMAKKKELCHETLSKPEAQIPDLNTGFGILAIFFVSLGMPKR